MKKIIKIEGMSCNHCKAKVEKVLNDIAGVSAKVNLKKKEAVVSFDADISNTIFKDAVKEAGYEAVSIEEKKGLFAK